MSELELSNLVKTQRQKKGLSRSKLSAMTGLHINTIVNVESGKSMPKFESVMKLCEALGVEIQFKIMEEIK